MDSHFEGRKPVMQRYMYHTPIHSTASFMYAVQAAIMSICSMYLIYVLSANTLSPIHSRSSRVLSFLGVLY